MNQQKVDMRHAEPLQAAFDRRLEIARRKIQVTHLGGEEYLVARHAGLADALPDLGLVVIEDGGIDMAVAHFQSRADRLDADVALQRHRAEPDGRNPRTLYLNHWNHSARPRFNRAGECRAGRRMPSVAYEHEGKLGQ